MKKALVSSVLAAVCMMTLCSCGAFGGPSQADVGAEERAIGTKQIEETVGPDHFCCYYWDVRVVKTERGYGAWREGPTGLGPRALSINDPEDIDRWFTTTLTGEYSVGKARIEAAVGVPIGGSVEYDTSYLLFLEEGDRKTIRFRPKMKIQTVESNYCRAPIGGGGTATVLKTERAYVTSFIEWDYSYVDGFDTAT